LDAGTILADDEESPRESAMKMTILWWMKSRVNLKMTLRKIAACAAVAATLSAGAGAQIVNKQIYPAVEAASADVNAALAEARSTHKRVILDFGGNWCPDCQVLNIYFHQSPNAALLAKYYVLVDVNIGRMDANLALAHKYGVPVTGVPALAVVDGSGKVVYAQSKEFEDMRTMQSSAVTEFLEKWKR
jgi:thiol:disulfide interchange protein